MEEDNFCLVAGSIRLQSSRAAMTGDSTVGLAAPQAQQPLTPARLSLGCCGPGCRCAAAGSKHHQTPHVTCVPLQQAHAIRQPQISRQGPAGSGGGGGTTSGGSGGGTTAHHRATRIAALGDSRALIRPSQGQLLLTGHGIQRVDGEGLLLLLLPPPAALLGDLWHWSLLCIALARAGARWLPQRPPAMLPTRPAGLLLLPATQQQRRAPQGRPAAQHLATRGTAPPSRWPY